MTTDDIIRLREQADDWAEKRLQCEGEFHPDFHTVSDERFAALLRDRMISEGWRQCAQGQRTSQHCGMVEQARQEEREACAKVCAEYDDDGGAGEAWAGRFAAAIRARGTLPAQVADRLARHGIQEPDDGPLAF